MITGAIRVTLTYCYNNNSVIVSNYYTGPSVGERSEKLLAIQNFKPLAICWSQIALIRPNGCKQCAVFQLHSKMNCWPFV